MTASLYQSAGDTAGDAASTCEGSGAAFGVVA